MALVRCSGAAVVDDEEVGKCGSGNKRKESKVEQAKRKTQLDPASKTQAGFPSSEKMRCALTLFFKHVAVEPFSRSHFHLHSIRTDTTVNEYIKETLEDRSMQRG